MTSTGDLRALAESWELAMHAKRVSPNTMRGYLIAVRQFLDWADTSGREIDLADPKTVRAWLAAHRDDWKASSALVKLGAIRSFAVFLRSEEDIDVGGVLAVPWPKVDQTIPPALSADDIAAMLAKCPVKTFPGIRDAAIISLLFDTMMRSDELLSMRRRTDDDPGDIDLRARTAHVRLGKGRKERYTAFGPETAVRVDRYLRHRARHQSASETALWLAMGRGKLTANGLYAAVRRRGEMAGIKTFPHAARAGGAIMWRRRGGSTEGLMTTGGWKTLAMVQHYTRAAEMELALDEARRLHERG